MWRFQLSRCNIYHVQHVQCSVLACGGAEVSTVVLSVPAWVSSSFLPPSKDVQVRSVGRSQLAAGVNVLDWLLVLMQDRSPVMSRFPADRPV